MNTLKADRQQSSVKRSAADNVGAKANSMPAVPAQLQGIRIQNPVTKPPTANNNTNIVQRIKIGKTDKTILEISKEIKENPNTPWHTEYSEILLNLELDNAEFPDMIALIMRMGAMKIGGAYKDVDETGYDADDDEPVFHEDDLYDASDTEEEDDEEDEDAIISEFNLDSKYLYRAEDFSEGTKISKETLPLYGFFSTSLAYSKGFYKTGKSGKNYNTMIRIVLSKPLGNVLIELIKSKDAFNQNSGDVGKELNKATGTKAEQKKVTGEREKKGILQKGGKKLDPKYKFAKAGSGNRSNTPNAVMIKQEPDVDESPITNIEITSRIEKIVKKGESVLVEHPLDKYVVSVEKFDPN